MAAERPEKPEVDAPNDGRTIIDFVDILFALVVGQILDVMSSWNAMSANDRAHLVFVFVLTLGSWVGYHSSVNRESGEVSFDLWDAVARIALGKLTIDITLVVAYWLAARNLIVGSAAPSVRGSLAAAAVTLVLYVFWDLLSFLDPRRLARGSNRSLRSYFSWRRCCSYGFAVTVGITVVVVAGTDPKTDWALATANIVLTVLAVAYRIAKEFTNQRESAGAGPRAAAV